MRKIAISDIHGHRKTLEALLDQIALSTADQLYLLGDFVDRGPDSKGVFDYMFELIDSGYQLHCLIGNHEEMMIRALEDDQYLDHWLYNGGQQTLNSFGVRLTEDIPEKYWEFIDDFEDYFEVDNYILVHAGLDFRVEDPFEAKEAMLWIRNWYQDIDTDWLQGRIIVHGHTTAPRWAIEKMFKNLDQAQVIDIDGGCYRSSMGYGQLCALDLSNREIYFQNNIG